MRPLAGQPTVRLDEAGVTSRLRGKVQYAVVGIDWFDVDGRGGSGFASWMPMGERGSSWTRYRSSGQGIGPETQMPVPVDLLCHVVGEEGDQVVVVPRWHVEAEDGTAQFRVRWSRLQAIEC